MRCASKHHIQTTPRPYFRQLSTPTASIRELNTVQTQGLVGPGCHLKRRLVKKMAVLSTLVTLVLSTPVCSDFAKGQSCPHVKGNFSPRLDGVLPTQTKKTIYHPDLLGVLVHVHDQELVVVNLDHLTWQGLFGRLLRLRVVFSRLKAAVGGKMTYAAHCAPRSSGFLRVLSWTDTCIARTGQLTKRWPNPLVVRSAIGNTKGSLG